MKCYKVESIKIDMIKKRVVVKKKSCALFPVTKYKRYIDPELNYLLKKFGKERVIKNILFSYYSGEYTGRRNNYSQSAILYSIENGEYVEEDSGVYKTKIKNRLYAYYKRYIHDKEKKYIVYDSIRKKYFKSFYRGGTKWTRVDNSVRLMSRSEAIASMHLIPQTTPSSFEMKIIKYKSDK